MTKTWADYINVGMEPGCFELSGLDQFMKGLADTAFGCLYPELGAMAGHVVTCVYGLPDPNFLNYPLWMFRDLEIWLTACGTR